MRVTLVLKLWAGIVSVTSSSGRPAALCGAGDRDTLSSTGHGGGVYSRGGCFVAFAPTAALTSTSSLRRGIYNLRSSSRRGAASTNGGIAMTSQVQPEPVGNNNAGDGSSNVVYTSAMTMKKLNGRTFYRRTLKPPCIAFSSDEGRQIFKEALNEGTMECYFRLAEQFRTQDEPAFCGLSTLTMVLNALAVDPGRVWKGPWRWYHESMLDCCAPLEVVKDKGVTMPTMCCLARCNGLNVMVAGPDTHTIEDLRAAVEECSTEDRGKVVVASYDRRGVNQTGTGHFSPVGGFHRGKDVMLVMDTARFKHPPQWIPVETLWEAMKRVDAETGRPRGFMVLEKAHNLSHRLFTAKSTNYKDWPQVASWVNEIVEQASRAPEEDKTGGCRQVQGIAPVADNGSGMRGLADATSVAEFVPALLALLPPVVTDLLTTFNSCEPEDQQAAGGGKFQDEKLKEEEEIHDDSKYQDGVVLQALQGTDVYKEITRMERSGWSSGVVSAAGSATASAAASAAAAAVDRGGDGGGAKGPDACAAKGDDGCGPKCGGANAQRTPSSQQAAATAVTPLPSTGPSTPSSSSSASSFWAEEHGCGCSSRHVVTIMTYAFLLLLHKRDHESSCVGYATGAGTGPGDVDEGGDGGGGDLPEPLWRKDPLRLLPAPVADEAKHVAGMLRGLVEMEKCEKCTQS